MKGLVNELQNASLLWAVLDGLHLPAFYTRSDFTIADCNTTVRKRLFFSAHEAAGLSIFDIIKIFPLPENHNFNSAVSVFEGSCIKKDRESFSAKITFIKQADSFFVIVEDLSEHKKLATRAEHRRKELNTYNALSKNLSRATEVEEMTERVLDTLLNAINCDSAWVYLTDSSSGELRLFSYKGLMPKTEGNPPALDSYEGFIKRVFNSEKALLVKNAFEDPRVSSINASLMEDGFYSIAGVPLAVKTIGDTKGKIVGVLGVADRMRDYFSSLNIQFLTSVGNQLGVAIENARLIASLNEKVKQIELINEISSVVNSSLSIGHIFRLAFSEIKKMIDFDRASITLLVENRDVLKIFAIDTERPTNLKKGVFAPITGTSAGWVTVNQKPWINRDLKKNMQFKHDAALRDEGICSTISVPLFKDRPLGALNLDSTIPDKFSEKYLETLLPVAKHLSIALENAILFEEISKEKRQWEKTFDAITDPVWIVDLKGKVLRVNRSVIEKSGKAELALIQKSSHEILKTLHIPEGKRLALEAIEHKKRLFKEIKGTDGSIYYFWIYPLLSSEGEIYGVVNYLRDVTEQKRLEQQLIRADKQASLGMLVAGVAHEINNPLGIIAGYSEALLDRAKDPELLKVPAFEDFPEYLDTINKEIFRCKDTLQGLLDFARPTGGIYREIDINDLVKEVILLVKHEAKTLNHQIELDLQKGMPVTMADPGAMRQVLINIIMNSFYFIEKKGIIVISTAYDRASGNKGFNRITISDNGTGIDRDVIDKIFDPYFSTKAIGEGTGLGLSICQRIISEHHGTIDVQSRKGSGTTFIIKIPVKSKS